MGTNKRYPHLGSQLAEERELREARKRGALHSLSADQLRLQSQVVTVVPERMQVWGLTWLRFGDVDVRSTVLVKRWTSDAVGVEVDVDGEKLRCWVWGGSVPAFTEPRGWVAIERAYARALRRLERYELSAPRPTPISPPAPKVEAVKGSS